MYHVCIYLGYWSAVCVNSVVRGGDGKSVNVVVGDSYLLLRVLCTLAGDRYMNGERDVVSDRSVMEVSSSQWVQTFQPIEKAINMADV